MFVTIRNSMHGVLLLPFLKKQRELIQGPIINLGTSRMYNEIQYIVLAYEMVGCVQLYYQSTKNIILTFTLKDCYYDKCI